jgi:hypothetical protein
MSAMNTSTNVIILMVYVVLFYVEESDSLIISQNQPTQTPGTPGSGPS